MWWRSGISPARDERAVLMACWLGRDIPFVPDGTCSAGRSTPGNKLPGYFRSSPPGWRCARATSLKAGAPQLIFVPLKTAKNLNPIAFRRRLQTVQDRFGSKVFEPQSLARGGRPIVLLGGINQIDP